MILFSVKNIHFLTGRPGQGHLKPEAYARQYRAQA